VENEIAVSSVLRCRPVRQDGRPVTTGAAGTLRYFRGGRGRGDPALRAAGPETGDPQPPTPRTAALQRHRADLSRSRSAHCSRPPWPRSGGASTLRVYAGWSPSADQRAASILSKRLPLPGRANETTVTIVNGKELGCLCGNATWSSLPIDGSRAAYSSQGTNCPRSRTSPGPTPSRSAPRRKRREHWPYSPTRSGSL
jgi:hypothetical protein